MRHLTVTQASVTSLFTAVVGVVLSVVTPLAPEKQAIVAAGGIVIAAVFAVAHLVAAIHAGKVKVTLSDLESGIRALAQDEVGKVNFSAVAEAVLNAHGLSDVGGVVRGELNKILVSNGLESAKAEAAVPVVDPNAPAAPPAA